MLFQVINKKIVMHLLIGIVLLTEVGVISCFIYMFFTAHSECYLFRIFDKWPIAMISEPKRSH